MGKKVIKYTGEKTYMFPNGELADKERVLKEFPAALTFTHIMETDEHEEMCFSMQNLSAMRGIYNIASSLTEDEAIAAIQEIINTVPEVEPSAEERIASALEFQNMMTLEDVEEGV
jgi:hypothetical protein